MNTFFWVFFLAGICISAFLVKLILLDFCTVNYGETCQAKNKNGCEFNVIFNIKIPSMRYYMRTTDKNHLSEFSPLFCENGQNRMFCR